MTIFPEIATLERIYRGTDKTWIGRWLEEDGDMEDAATYTHENYSRG